MSYKFNEIGLGFESVTSEANNEFQNGVGEVVIDSKPDISGFLEKLPTNYTQTLLNYENKDLKQT